MKKIKSLLFFVPLFLINAQRWPLIAIFFLGLTILISSLSRSLKKINDLILKSIIIFGMIAIVWKVWGTPMDVVAATFMLCNLGAIKLMELRSPRDKLNFYAIILIAQASTAIQLETLTEAVMLFLSVFLLPIGQLESSLKNLWRIHRATIPVLILITIIVSLGFPRVNLGGFWQRPDQRNGDAQNLLRPGDVSKVAQDESEYFRFTWNSSENIPLYLLYWRVGVLEKHDGGLNFSGLRNNVQSSPSIEKGIVYEVVQLKTLMNSLVHLDGPTIIDSQSPFTYRAMNDGSFDIRKIGNGLIHYKGTTSYTTTMANPTRRHLGIQGISKKVERLARQLKKSKPRETVAALSQYLKDSQMTYTLNPGLYEGRAMLDDFLFNRKKGFCEHYAAASVVLLRAMGISSRVVLGFLGANANPYGPVYSVRGQQAHAWVEYVNEANQWERFDPVIYVAPETLRESATGGAMGQKFQFLKSLDQLMVMAEYWAYNFFYAFTFDRQVLFLKRLGVWLNSFRGLVLALLLVCACALLIFINWKKNKINVDKKFESYLMALSRLGFKYDNHQGIFENLDNISEKIRSEQDSTIFNLFARIRYGEEDCKDQYFRVLEERVRAIGKNNFKNFKAKQG